MNTFLWRVIQALFSVLGISLALCSVAIWLGTIGEGNIIGFIGPRGDALWGDNYFAVNGYDVRTQNIVPLTSANLYPQLFSWSHDGAYLGVIARPYGNSSATSALYAMKSNGEGMRLISGDLSVIIASERPPFWASDNQHMVFQAIQGGGNVVQFYIGYLDGTSPQLVDINHPLAQAYIQNFFPTYQTAPNGKYRVLVDYRNNEWGLFLVIGDRQQKIYHLTSETIMPDAADWSPDSQLIAFSRRKKNIPMIYVINMTGDVMFKIEQGRYPLWKP